MWLTTHGEPQGKHSPTWNCLKEAGWKFFPRYNFLTQGSCLSPSVAPGIGLVACPSPSCPSCCCCWLPKCYSRQPKLLLYTFCWWKILGTTYGINKCSGFIVEQAFIDNMQRVTDFLLGEEHRIVSVGWKGLFFWLLYWSCSFWVSLIPVQFSDAVACRWNTQWVWPLGVTFC